MMNKNSNIGLGFSQKQIIELFVYSYLLTNGESYPQQVYEHMNTSFPFKKRSRYYIYKVMKEMVSNSKLAFRQEGRRTLYSITSKGEQEYRSFESKHVQKLKKVSMILNDIISDVKGKSQVSTMFVDEEDRRFVSKVINVRDLIRFFMLRELLRNDYVHGASVYRSMQLKYGWKNSDSYFYTILRKMESPQKYDSDSIEAPLIESYWEDPDSRSIRLYKINDFGRDVYPQLKESLLTELINVRRAINEIIRFFEGE